MDEAVDPVERAIRDAIEAGEFDGLPGTGRPLPDIDDPYEPGWWAKRWLDRDRRTVAANDLRRTIREELPRLRAASDRAAAQRRVAELNALVDELNAGLPESERLAEVRLERPGA